MGPDTSKRVCVILLMQHILLGLEPKLSSALHDATDYSTLMNRILNQADSRVPPNIDKATEIKLGITVDQIISIRNEDMSFTVKLKLHQSWVDDRLIRNSTFKDMLLPADRIFIPDTFIRLALL